MTLLSGACWAVTDDDGTGTTGTAGNAAWVDAVEASINALIHSTANPTVTPEDIIDEVVEARAAFGDLDARLDDIEADIAASLPNSTQIANAIGQQNLASNEIFLIWHAGDAVAPSMFFASGAGASVARCGTGLADTNTKIGDFCARLRRVAATSKLTQTIISGSAFTKVGSAFKGKVVGIGAWVRSTAIGGANLFVGDGVGTTDSPTNTLANTWEWLSTTRTLDSGATELNVGIQNNTNGADAYLSGLTVVLGDIGQAPTEWFPAPTEYHSYNYTIPGVLAVATNRIVVPVHRPGIVKDIQLTIGTVPTGAALIVDVNTWDGAAFTTMCATKPQIAASGRGSASTPPDSATYARKCLYPDFSIPSVTGGMLAIDIDQIGSVVAGSDLTVSVRVLHPLRFLESVLLYNDI